MHIAVDAHRLNAEVMTGGEIYTLNLLGSLAALDRENRYTLYVDRPTQDRFGKDNFKFKALRQPTPRLWHLATLPRELLSHKPDVLFMPGFLIPVYHPGRVVVSFLDLAFRIFPGILKTRLAFVFERQVAFAARHADAIIAISESTKRDIVKFYDIPPEKIFVTYLGYEAGLFKPETDEVRTAGVLTKHGINTEFVLCVGTLEPRKNLDRLIEAFALFKKQSGAGHKLVITGAKGWLYDKIFETVSELKLENEVVFTGYVAREDLPSLFSRAGVFVYPSLYEGFGLPPLEAMACGAPVITSNVSSLPEVVGEAGAMVDPYDVQGLAEAISRVLTEESLRREMAAKGIERAKLFSWEKAAAQTLAVFQHVRNR